MPKFQADVTLDDLPTVNRLPEDFNREYKIRVKFNKKVSSFDALNYLVSDWVARRRSLNFNELNILLHNCLEVIRKNPEVVRGKGKLAFHLSKYDVLDFRKDPETVRRRLIQINKIEEILYSPRALGSEKWKELKDFYIYVDIYPGPCKNDFPHQTFIGVGYRDKGNSRNRAIDGSPTLRELALSNLSFSVKEKKKALVERQQISLLQDESWRQLRRKQIARSTKQRRQRFSLLD